MSSSEGYFSKARVEAFSDGVMAVIITIMVLDLKAPESAEPSELLKLWPSFAIYLVSFFLLMIYWINHHGLIAQARRVTTGLLWANGGVLFWASLIPFSTTYVAKTHLAPIAMATYAGLQCVCAIAFNVMSRSISERQDDSASRQRAKTKRRWNLIAVAVYAISTVVALFSPLAAILLLTLVSLAYVAPTFVDERKET